MKTRLFALLLLACSVGAFAQAKKPVAKKPGSVAGKTIVKKPVAGTKAVMPKAGEGIFAEIQTTRGKIVLSLEYTKVPVTVANFISLAEGTNTFVTTPDRIGKPFFNGLKFHRVIADFMIQGGDPLGNGSGSPGYKFKDEETTDVFDKPGVLAMANSGPNTNGSQFFITHKETPWLNHKHTIFGHVLTGQDVVNAVKQDDVINSITIKRVGAAAKAFNAPKVFSDYYGNKAEDEKKQLAKEAADKKKRDDEAAAQKKVYMTQYASVINAKVAEFAQQKASSTQTASGLQYAVLKKGSGTKPAEQSTVYIHYAGYFEDGTLFDSSYAEVNKAYGKFDEGRASQDGYRPFPFQYGAKGGLIPGFLEGVNLMSIGDKYMLFIPSNLGYGAGGAGNVIPPNANLIFEVELLDKQ